MTVDLNKLTLIAGLGSIDDNTACVVSAARAKWLIARGEPLTEMSNSLECACPVLRKALIVTNDATWWRDDAERTVVLGPWIDRIIDSRGSDALTLRRACRLADAAVREFAPLVLDAAGLPEQAESLRALPQIVYAATARAADFAYAAARAASDAADFAYVAADAARIATDAARTAIRDRFLAILDECALMTEEA